MVMWIDRGVLMMRGWAPCATREIHNLGGIALIIIVAMMRPVRRPVLCHQAGSADTPLVLTLHHRA